MGSECPVHRSLMATASGVSARVSRRKLGVISSQKSASWQAQVSTFYRNFFKRLKKSAFILTRHLLMELLTQQF